MIDVQGLTVRYSGREGPTLRDAHLHIAPGELVLVSGPTGCGKSTLLNAINGVLAHESDAEISGEVTVDGRDVSTMPLHALCRLVGSVFQNPDSQLCTATPETEVAFGLENMAVERTAMRRRIAQALDTVGLSHCREQPTATLSGGQKQRLAIACALALAPKALLLDEPISQLDPEGAAEILALIARLKDAHDRAVLVIEHRIEDVARLADRVAIMAEGRLVSDRPRAAAFLDLGVLRRLGLAVPHLPDLFERLGRTERPLSAQEAPDIQARRTLPERTLEDATPQPVGTVRGVRFRYGRHAPCVLEDVDLDLHCGDRIALMGPNGSGKSTLLHVLAGMLRPSAGAVEWEGGTRPSLGLVVQQPDLMLFQETVRDEVEFAPRHRGLGPAARAQVAGAVLADMGIDDLADEAPFALSRGQRLRTAVGSVLTMRPRVLLLDEPTTGQDRDQIGRMMEGLSEDVDLLVFCTHDVDTVARHANRVLLLASGRIIADGSPRQVLFDEERMGAASIRPTSAQAYARRIGVAALQVDELVEVLS